MLQKLPRKLLPALSSKATPDALLQLQDDGQPHPAILDLTGGIIRCRYRDSWEKPKFLEPGEIAEVTIELHPTSNLFIAGHRIRCDISSSNFPQFDVNPNTGEPEGKALRRRMAVNTVHLNQIHASHVLLPIVSQELR